MEILHLDEIPKHHIVKRWTRDARDILPEHLVQYQKDNLVNLSFTCRHATLYLKAMKSCGWAMQVLHVMSICMQAWKLSW